MIEKAQTIVNLLIETKKQIATMESCTGGGLANMITNIPGASEIILFSAVTYSNEYKIKMGVPKEIIEKYTVYSIETAKAMAEAIASFAHSHFGVGITGTLKKIDPNNESENDDFVYFSIYDKEKNLFYNKTLTVTKESRQENKACVIEMVLEELYKILSL